MNNWILLPPVAFVIVLVLMSLQLTSMGFVSFPKKLTRLAPGKNKPYACGHDMDHRVRPDYSQFFHFAFFFTLMHVVALVVATVPGRSISAACLARLYLVASAIGLFVLYRRW